MSTAKKPPKAVVAAQRSKPADDELGFEVDPQDSTTLRVAKMALGPTASSALTAETYTKLMFGPMAMSDAFEALSSSITAVEGGKLGDAEGMLVAQAAALNAIFNELAMRADGQSQMRHLETFLRLSLKAQAQCRMTLETLATIKNPPVVFARQANIANGPQQVNYPAPAVLSTQTKRDGNAATGLLEVEGIGGAECPPAGVAGAAFEKPAAFRATLIKQAN